MHARHYDGGVGTDHYGSTVAELHWKDGRSVQISGAEAEDSRGKHLMIRLWPEKGTVSMAA